MKAPTRCVKEYEYRPLDTAKQQIRLLKIRPSSSSPENSGFANTVHCELKTFNVETAPPYIALSYCWSLPVPVAIYVNGQLFHVRWNLYNFLTTFANEKSNHYYIWIDQICIDQTSICERNHQIQMMSQIYQRCVFVIAWLFKGSDDRARNFIHNPNSKTAQELLSSSYFTRIWIVQEIMLAPKVQFLCGTIWLPFEELEAVVNDPNYHRKYGLTAADYLFIDRIHGQSMGLKPALEKFRRMQCHDFHDKIYALLGFITPDQRPEVDYTKTRHETFLDVLRIVLDLYWKDIEFKYLWEDGDPRSKEDSFPFVGIFCHDLARSLGIDHDHGIQVVELLRKLYDMGLRRAERKEGCLVPQIGFHEGRWWCEDEGERYTVPASTYKI